MAQPRTNIRQVIAGLDRFMAGFNFTRPGKDQSLGRDIVTTIALGIQERSVQDKCGPAGAWAANEPHYAEAKEKAYGVVDQPNVRTGQMLSLPSLKGTSTRIEPQSIEMVYGTGLAPTGTGTGAPLRPADAATTDREKAHYAHAGQSEHGIQRPFYQADATIAGGVREVCRENLNGYIRHHNAQMGKKP